MLQSNCYIRICLFVNYRIFCSHFDSAEPASPVVPHAASSCLSPAASNPATAPGSSCSVALPDDSPRNALITESTQPASSALVVLPGDSPMNTLSTGSPHVVGCEEWKYIAQGDVDRKYICSECSEPLCRSEILIESKLLDGRRDELHDPHSLPGRCFSCVGGCGPCRNPIPEMKHFRWTSDGFEQALKKFRKMVGKRWDARIAN